MILMETVRHITVTYNLGDLADWVSALATVAAVIVSLYLANRRDKPRILITFIDRKQDICRITNKSSQPVELKLKLSGEKSYSSFPVPPRRNEVIDLRDEQPFNKDYITFEFSPKGRLLLKAKAIDIASNSKYYFIFYKIGDYWWINQYSFRVTWLVSLAWRKLYERIQKSKRRKLAK